MIDSRHLLFTPHLARLLALVVLLSLAGQQLVRMDCWMEKAEVELELNLESDAEGGEEIQWEDPWATVHSANHHALARLHRDRRGTLDLRAAHPEFPCKEVNTPPPEMRA